MKDQEVYDLIKKLRKKKKDPENEYLYGDMEPIPEMPQYDKDIQNINDATEKLRQLRKKKNGY